MISCIVDLRAPEVLSLGTGAWRLWLPRTQARELPTLRPRVHRPSVLYRLTLPCLHLVPCPSGHNSSLALLSLTPWQKPDSWMAPWLPKSARRLQNSWLPRARRCPRRCPRRCSWVLATPSPLQPRRWQRRPQLPRPPSPAADSRAPRQPRRRVPGSPRPWPWRPARARCPPPSLRARRRPAPAARSWCPLAPAPSASARPPQGPRRATSIARGCAAS
mmetsp:Transcript_86619/g.280440  ORF Transcript_86619/g.280440 Transcript_86619/m.280440 type:complete len:218 (-) Transcript_86619:73-726(-)